MVCPTNTYSESIFTNDDLEEASIGTGTVLSVKYNNTDVSAVVLCKGTLEQMEGLESLLEDLADANWETDDVMTKGRKSIKSWKIPSLTNLFDKQTIQVIKLFTWIQQFRYNNGTQISDFLCTGEPGIHTVTSNTHLPILPGLLLHVLLS